MIRTDTGLARTVSKCPDPKPGLRIGYGGGDLPGESSYRGSVRKDAIVVHLVDLPITRAWVDTATLVC